MKKEIDYSTNVLELLNKKPPFVIRYGYIFLILFIFSFYIIGNLVKVPIFIHLSYLETENKIPTFVFKDSKNLFSEIKNTEDLYITNGDKTVKIKQINKLRDKILITVTIKDYLALQSKYSNTKLQLFHYINLTTYIYNFLFNI